jgi:hypothetical protein
MNGLFGHGPRKWQGDDATWVQRHSLSLFLGVLTLAQTIGAMAAYWYVVGGGLLWRPAPGPRLALVLRGRLGGKQ